MISSPQHGRRIYRSSFLPLLFTNPQNKNWGNSVTLATNYSCSAARNCWWREGKRGRDGGTARRSARSTHAELSWGCTFKIYSGVFSHVSLLFPLFCAVSRSHCCFSSRSPGLHEGCSNTTCFLWHPLGGELYNLSLIFIYSWVTVFFWLFYRGCDGALSRACLVLYINTCCCF